MIKVLIVDDSQTTLDYLKYLLSSDKEIVVEGIADNGKEAVELAQREPLDVILMDIHMPQMDGFEATRIIMERNPAPIVIMSASHNVKDTDVIFRAMEAGAVALANKPKGLDHPDHESSEKELIQTVKSMAEIKVIRRRPIVKQKPEEGKPRPESLFAKPIISPAAIRVIAMGASAGGPPVLQAILSRIPERFPVPLLIVQHIACGFVEGLIEWLSKTADCPIHLATHEETPLAGHIYFAPDNYHMGVGTPAESFFPRASRKTVPALHIVSVPERGGGLWRQCRRCFAYRHGPGRGRRPETHERPRGDYHRAGPGKFFGPWDGGRGNQTQWGNV